MCERQAFALRARRQTTGFAIRGLTAACSLISLMAFAQPAWATDYKSLSGDALARFVRHDCGSCHGLSLQGGLGPALTPESLSRYDVQALGNVVLAGVPGSAMPPWAGILSREQAFWIAEVLKKGELPW